jgi:CRISPR-associated protein Csx14
MKPTARTAISVDLHNPAEFLACCGLLEAGHRLNTDIQGWFDGDQFCTRGDGALAPRNILAAVTSWALASESEDQRDKAPPLIIAAPRPLRLDWWLDPARRRRADGEAAATPFKLWAGQQSSLSILEALLCAAKKSVTEDGGDPLRRRVPLSGRFGFDPTAAWVALDVGWSPNEQGVEVGTAAAVELLAAIGLQRFRPAAVPDASYEYQYTAWTVPLPPAVARGVCRGVPFAGGSNIPLQNRQTRQLQGIRPSDRNGDPLMSTETLKKHDAWLAEDGPAALVMREYLMPVEGKDAPVFPATFAASEDGEFHGGYNIDRFDGGRSVCLIDSVGAQANRMEPLFK